MRYILLILSLLCSPVFAQEIAEDRNFVYDDFSGGLNTELSNHTLPKTQSIIAENVRFHKKLKSLSKRDEVYTYGTNAQGEVGLGLFRLYLKDSTKVLLSNHGDQIDMGSDTTGAFTKILDLSSGGYRWQWTTWHDIGIGTDGYNQPVKYDGSSASATYLGTCLATDAGSGAGPDGTYLYKISFYTASYEILFNVPSNSITVSDNDITLTMIPQGPDTYGGEAIVGRKVYRTLDSGSTYKLLTNGTIANNTAVTLTDSDADGALGASYPAGDATYQPPKGRLILLHKNRLFIANDPSNPSRIYYSEDGEHDVFKTGAYFNIRNDDGDEITFIKNVYGLLTIGKTNTIQKLYTDGDDPSADWAISDPFSHIGCRGIYTAVDSPLGVIYLANDGIYAFNGKGSQLISEAITPEIQDIEPTNYAKCWGAFHKSNYYLAYTSATTGATDNDKVLVLDVLSNAYSIDLLNINTFATFNSGTDWGILYSTSSLNGKVYAHSDTTYNILHKSHSDFTGTWDDSRYIPVRWGGDADEAKLEISWTDTIDDGVGTLDSLTGIIDRPDTNGFYISQILNINANQLDKLYWNETIPSAGGDVTFAVRSAASTPDCLTAAWSSEFSDPSGSDISNALATDLSYLQYRATMSTTEIQYTPNIYFNGGYTVKILYSKQGVSSETTIPLHWRSGWNDLGFPGYKKVLRKISAYYESAETGTLDLIFDTYQGQTDTFNIDLSVYPDSYIEYFSTGALEGELFRLDISETSLNALRIDKIILVFDVEPLV